MLHSDTVLSLAYNIYLLGYNTCQPRLDACTAKLASLGRLLLSNVVEQLSNFQQKSTVIESNKCCSNAFQTCNSVEHSAAGRETRTS